jgi:hypothetical protein
VTFAREYEAPPQVWGVGRVVVGDEIIPWAVSEADIDDETEIAASHYRSIGLGDGDLVLVVALLSQAIHAVPLERGAGAVGALYSSADATRFDAFRTASLVRQLDAKIVIGVDTEVLTGLADLGRDLGDVFSTVHAVIAADADAQGRLADAGVATGRWLRLGPTNAVGVPGEPWLAYDAQRWQAEEDGGELVLTNIASRLTACDRFRTGVRGSVPEPGRLVLAS